MADTPLTVTVGAATLTGYAPAVKRDYTIRPGVAALAGTGYAPRLFPEGQTAEPAETTRRYSPRAPYGGAVTCMTMTQTLALYGLVKNCQKGFGFVPGGVTVIAFMVQSADLDSGTPALVQSILLGSTALVLYLRGTGPVCLIMENNSFFAHETAVVDPGCSIGEGTRTYVLSQFTQFGTTLAGFSPGKISTSGLPGALGNTVHPLTFEDAEALERVPGLTGLSR